MLVLLASIPTAQLRCAAKTHFQRPGDGSDLMPLPGTLGLSWTFAPPALVETGILQSSPEIRVYAIAGVLMATTVAIITGLCWLSWIKRGNLRMVVREILD